MEGHYDGNVYGTGAAVPDEILSINVTNIPEFNLSDFELNINFAVDSKKLKSE